MPSVVVWVCEVGTGVCVLDWKRVPQKLSFHYGGRKDTFGEFRAMEETVKLVRGESDVSSHANDKEVFGRNLCEKFD